MRARPALLVLLLCACSAAADGDQVMREARLRWQASPHGEMLSRIIPPFLEPSQLPEPESRGARLTATYCVQCHNLASPAMHDSAKWPAIVDRMVPRMRGRGNLGPLMRDLMTDIAAPGADEVKVLMAYLAKHGQEPADPNRLPEAGHSQAWRSYTQACNQCHTLPDPRRHSRAEWPGVVARMERNMAWMNRVVGSKRDPREPQYRADEIVAYLQRHARR